MQAQAEANYFLNFIVNPADAFSLYGCLLLILYGQLTGC
jgi:hypothetical protein